MKFDQRTKKQKKKEEKGKELPPQVQLVPYEQFSYKALLAINNSLQKIQSDMDIIKERITFEDAEKKNK